MSQIYAVTSFPSNPYEGASYYNVQLQLLGTFRNNTWSYYKPRTLKLPADSYDIDQDGIPDDVDSSIDLTYTSGTFTTPSGNEANPNPSDISGSITSVTQNGTDTDKSFTPTGPGFIVLDDGTIITFNFGPGNTTPIDLPPGSTLFLCDGLIDGDGDGIPDDFDTEAGYQPPGNFENTGIDPSLFLDPIDSGSKNTSGKTYGFYASQGGMLLCADGNFSFFKQNQLVYVDDGCTVFFGQLQDSNNNGIPDSLDTELGYTGGSFTIPGSSPSITIADPFSPRNLLGPTCTGGSKNNSQTPYTITAEQDGVYYTETGEIGFFYEGESVVVNPGVSIFFGELSDNDGDRIPNEFDQTEGHAGGNSFITSQGETIPAALLHNVDDGSTNTSDLTYILDPKNSGMIVNPDGSFSYFQKGDFISVPPGSTVFLSLVSSVIDFPIDTDGDGTPDSLDKNAGYPGTGDFETEGGIFINVSAYLTNSDSGSFNDSGTAYSKTANQDGVIVSDKGSLLFFKSGDSVTINHLDTIFHGDLIDSNNNVIPDVLDTSTPSVTTSILGNTVDSSDFLTTGPTGSRNESGGAFSFVSSSEGFLFNSDGSVDIFKASEIVLIQDQSTAFFGQLIDTNNNGIPDNLETPANYGGTGGFTTQNGTTVIVSDLITDPDGGSTNNTGETYTFIAQEDGVLIGPNGEKIFFKKGQEVEVKDGWTVFFGSIVDLDDNGIPDHLETSLNYPGSGSITLPSGFEIDPSLIVISCSGGSTNTSGSTYSFVANRDGFVARADGSIEIFYKGDVVTVHDGDSVFFGSIKSADDDKDGIPDNLETSGNYQGTDPFVFTNTDGSILGPVNISEYMENSDAGSINSTGFPLTVKTKYPGIIVCANSEPYLVLPGKVTIPPGCALFRCLPEDETKSSNLFFSIDNEGSITLSTEPVQINGFSIKLVDKIGENNFQLKEKPYISTTDFTESFSITDEINITLNDS